MNALIYDGVNSERPPSDARKAKTEKRIMRNHLNVVLAGLSLCSLLISARASDLSAAKVRSVAGNGRPGPFVSDGPATGTAVNQPFGVCAGPDGALYVCEVGQHVVRRVDLRSGALTTVAGCGRKGYSGDGGPATEAELNEPYEVRFDSQGNMYFVEMQNHLVRRVDRRTGVITTIAGCGESGFAGDGGKASLARLNRPHSIAFDGEDNLYICDIGNHRIRLVNTASGTITTWAGTGEKKPTPDGAPVGGTPLNGPRALDYDGRSSMYLALREGNAIWRIDLATQRLHHVAGTGESGYSGDGGPAVAAKLSGPKGIAVGPDGDIYFADTESHTVRVVRAESAILETVIGDGKKGNGPNGEPTACRLDRPHGIYVSDDGQLFVGDSNNHLVRGLDL
jgi:streptogramin lyase